MNRMIAKGLLAFSCVALFSQCADKSSEAASSVSPKEATGDLSGMRVAFVEIDTLLTKYNFCIDLNKEMVKKGENVRLQINEEANKLAKEKQEWQKKYEANAFLSQKSAEDQYNTILKHEQDLQELSTKLQNGLLEESNKNNLLFRDSINAFLKEYNKTHQYDLIFSNTGLDNLLYADEAYNITDEIVEGLNARYKSKEE